MSIIFQYFDGKSAILVPNFYVKYAFFLMVEIYSVLDIIFVIKKIILS